MSEQGLLDIEEKDGNSPSEGEEWKDDSDELAQAFAKVVLISDKISTSSSSGSEMEISEKSEEMKMIDDDEKENTCVKEDDEEEDKETGIQFFPPVYLQRYARVREELIKRLEKLNLEPGSFKSVVEFGCAEFGMHFHLKHLPNIGKIVYVDIDKYLLESRLNSVRPLPFESLSKRETPLCVEVYAGCATEADSRIINSDMPVHAIVGIEILEHLNKDVEEKFVYNLFKNYAPPLVILTTPNGDFNPVFGLQKGKFRHWDHRFELSRQEFIDWCTMVCNNFPMYSFSVQEIGEGPPGTEEFGCVSQMAIFELKLDYVPNPEEEERNYAFCNDSYRVDRPVTKTDAELKTVDFQANSSNRSEPYELLISIDYPWSPKLPLRTRVINETRFYINTYCLSVYNLERHYENGGGESIFMSVESLMEMLGRNVPDAIEEKSQQEILDWLNEEGFEVTKSEGKNGIEIPIPQQEETEEEYSDYDYDQDERSGDGIANQETWNPEDDDWD